MDIRMVRKKGNCVCLKSRDRDVDIQEEVGGRKFLFEMRSQLHRRLDEKD